jgi:hypothetical protein
VLAASDDRLPQGRAGGLVLLQARVPHLSLAIILFQQTAFSRVLWPGVEWRKHCAANRSQAYSRNQLRNRAY